MVKRFFSDNVSSCPDVISTVLSQGYDLVDRDMNCFDIIRFDTSENEPCKVAHLVVLAIVMTS